MQQENAIEVKNITKSFKVFFDKGHHLKEKLLFKSRNRFEERRVLNDISFSVKKGEAIGLIGQNGCGKSTTLKLLTKIIYPDNGTIDMKGRVSSLIELGAGFHPDMSGRDNIYTNAAIFGLTKKEIDLRLDDIIAFSELGDYIDNPVRTYSSGMYMRLAFSVAINVDADILLIDEILAVGDAAFQAKCFNRLREIKAAGTTIVIVSHAMGQIEQICDRALWIKDGELELDGVPRNTIQAYMSWIMGDRDEIFPTKTKIKKVEKPEKTYNAIEAKSFEYTAQDILELKKKGKIVEIGNRAVEIIDYELLDGKSMKPQKRFSIGGDVCFRIQYRRNDLNIKESMCSLSIYRSDGLNCYSTNSFINTGENIKLKDEGVIELTIKKCPFMQGEYKLDISLNKDYGPTYHGILNACLMEIYNVTTDYGVCRPEIEWRLSGCSQTDIPIFDDKVNSNNYKTILKLNEVLEINKFAPNITDGMNRSYDLIVICRDIKDIGIKNSIIASALNVTNYLLIEDETYYHFKERIKKCVAFESNNRKDVLIPLSAKNKEVIAEIIAEMEENIAKEKWLLHCFEDESIIFELAKGEARKIGNNKYAFSISLINKTEIPILLLDEGIFFGSRKNCQGEKLEGERTPIKKTLYPGINEYEIIVEGHKGDIEEVTIVKEQEYWLSDILPKCIETIEL